MIKKTVTLPNKILRQQSQEIMIPLSQGDEAIAQNLIFYLEETNKKDNNLRPGIGIAAVQLGFLKRMFFVHVINNDGEERELLINPKIESYSQTYAALERGEGCLSIDDNITNQSGFVHRRNKIVISGYSYFQKKHITLIKTGLIAIVYQHEMDHLNGKLFIDSINKKDPWKKLDHEIII